jgi:glycosyltransferase involved in cell wall biosynthesis
VAAIALDYTPAFEQSAGIGRYVRELVAGIARQYTRDDEFRLFVSGVNQSSLSTTPSDQFKWKSTRISPRWLARIWHRAQLPLPVELFVGRIDLFHATDFVLPPHFPLTRTLLTVHDLSFVRVPEAAPPSLKAYLNVVVPRSAQRATHILADSSATKADLIELYDIEEHKITVLLSGVDGRFRRDTSNEGQLRQKYKIGDRPYLLSVGTVQPRKNYIRLVQALEVLHQRGYEVDLVISGGWGWLNNPLFLTIDNSPAKDHIHLIGFADDEDLPGLYSSATCLAFPSLYEGFGFPVLEAMACGTPVMTSNVSSLPEVAGEAALLVNPVDTDEIIETLDRMLSDQALRGRLIELGYTQATKFSWDNTARNLLGIYSQVLNMSQTI